MTVTLMLFSLISVILALKYFSLTGSTTVEKYKTGCDAEEAYYANSRYDTGGYN